MKTPCYFLKTAIALAVLCAGILLASCNRDGTLPTEYTINVTVSGDGTAEANAVTALAGDMVIISASTDNDNYQFAQWVATSANIGSFAPSATAEKAMFVMPEGNVEVKAEFVPVAAYVDSFITDATIAFDAEASDDTKTVYTFTLPNAPEGVTVTSVVISGTALIKSSTAGKVMTITSSAMEAAVGPNISVVFGVSYMGVASSITSTLTLPFTGAAKNALGGRYYQKGIVTGIVYTAKSGPGTGRAVSIDEIVHVWSWNKGNFGASSDSDGLANLNAIYESGDSKIQYTFDQFPPVQAFIGPKNPAYIIYTSGATDIWYLPAKDELAALYSAWNGGSGPDEVNGQRYLFNSWLTSTGGTAIGSRNYWSSTENNKWEAWYVYFNNGNLNTSSKSNQDVRIRAILAF